MYISGAGGHSCEEVAVRVIGAEAKRRGDWRERQEVKIEERSFVANGAPLDDGQRRMVRGERATAEPGKAAKSGRAALEILRPHNNVRWRAFGAVGFDGSGACRKRRLAAALRREEAAMMIAKRKAAGLRPTLQRRMRLDGTACGEVRAIEERSFVAKGAPQDDGQGRMVRGEQAAAEPGQAVTRRRVWIGRRGREVGPGCGERRRLRLELLFLPARSAERKCAGCCRAGLAG